jgi:hypothetical protein
MKPVDEIVASILSTDLSSEGTLGVNSSKLLSRVDRDGLSLGRLFFSFPNPAKEWRATKDGRLEDDCNFEALVVGV